VIVIPAGNPSAWTGPTGTNTYLLPGRTPALIDAGVGHASHLDAVAAALGGQPLALVLLTHGHSDHASGVPAILARWPDAEVRPTARPFTDRESIAAGDGSLTALHTPGHAPDHYCFFDSHRREVFCGDMVQKGGTIVIPGSRGGDLRAYLRSLERIRLLSPLRLWPGHGPAIDDPDAIIAQYVRHRAWREAQIIGSLARGYGTPQEIAADVYGPMPVQLSAAAADSVLAHLRKLVDEDVVAVAGERYVFRQA
jgi:glyoxylase-like metal-dependent hydrolase (beta-lactamase superfamily II)